MGDSFEKHRPAQFDLSAGELADVVTHHRALDGEEEVERRFHLGECLEIPLAFADDEVRRVKEVAELLRTGGQRRPGAVGAVADNPAEPVQSTGDGVCMQGVVDDGTLLDNKDDFPVQLFDDQPVKNELAAVVAEIEYRSGPVEIGAECGIVIDRWFPVQGRADGPFDVEGVAGAVINDVAGQGKEQGGIKRIVSRSDLLADAGNEIEGQLVALPFQSAEGVGAGGDLGDEPIESHRVFRRARG